ncbi:hypothetical protein EVAR_58898_1 [Eumeta japonica]|uniref:Uncharacterized protein n=1 Tax=Eumeta variegata TaxID=151549 RepID=A0A4C1YZG0_EUMVA|nr:hypothetical protein EVAR_58898_1 [Eumeta japonica]
MQDYQQRLRNRMVFHNTFQQRPAAELRRAKLSTLHPRNIIYTRCRAADTIWVKFATRPQARNRKPTNLLSPGDKIFISFVKRDGPSEDYEKVPLGFSNSESA